MLSSPSLLSPACHLPSLPLPHGSAAPPVYPELLRAFLPVPGPGVLPPVWCLQGQLRQPAHSLCELGRAKGHTVVLHL